MFLHGSYLFVKYNSTIKVYLDSKIEGNGILYEVNAEDDLESS